MAKKNDDKKISEEEEKAVEEACKLLSPEDLQSLFEEAKEAAPLDDFLNSVFVGDCPRCGSNKTMDGEGVPDLDDITVGLCRECGCMWCLECEQIFEKNQKGCRHWGICETCEFMTKEGCEIPPWECSIIQDWREKKG